MLDFLLHTGHVSLVIKLNPVGLFNSDTQLYASLSERIVDIVRSIVVTAAVASSLLWALVDHDPLIFQQVDSLLDGKFTKHIFINVDHLVLLEDLRSSEDSLTAELNWVARKGDIPVFQDLLLHQEVHTVVDLSHLLVRVDSADGKGVTHTRTSADGLRDAIDSAELRRQMNETVTVLYDD